MAKKLTAKQLKFIQVYAGNGVQAARLAGYKGSDDTLAQVARENLSKPQILSEIQKRQAEENNPLIASRQMRQIFWSNVMKSNKVKMSDRLKASELLGKSEADFTEKHEVNNTGIPPQIIITLPSNKRESNK